MVLVGRHMMDVCATVRWAAARRTVRRRVAKAGNTRRALDDFDERDIDYDGDIRSRAGRRCVTSFQKERESPVRVLDGYRTETRTTGNVGMVGEMSPNKQSFCLIACPSPSGHLRYQRNSLQWLRDGELRRLRSTCSW